MSISRIRESYEPRNELTRRALELKKTEDRMTPKERIDKRFAEQTRFTPMEKPTEGQIEVALAALKVVTPWLPDPLKSASETGGVIGHQVAGPVGEVVGRVVPLVAVPVIAVKKALQWLNSDPKEEEKPEGPQVTIPRARM